MRDSHLRPELHSPSPNLLASSNRRSYDDGPPYFKDQVRSHSDSERREPVVAPVIVATAEALSDSQLIQRADQLRARAVVVEQQEPNSVPMFTAQSCSDELELTEEEQQKSGQSENEILAKPRFCSWARRHPYVVVLVVLMMVLIVVAAVVGVTLHFSRTETYSGNSQSNDIVDTATINSTVGDVVAGDDADDDKVDYHIEHSIPASEYQTHYDRFSGNGYRLVLVTGFEDETGETRYNTIWKLNTDTVEWQGFHGIRLFEVQSLFDDLVSQGYRMVFFDNFGNPVLHNAIYILDPASFGSWSANMGFTSGSYQLFALSQFAMGWDLDLVTTYQDDGSDRYGCIWTDDSRNYPWQTHHADNAAQYQAHLDQYVGQGYTPEYVSVGTIDVNEPLFSSLFVKYPESIRPHFQAFHGVVDIQAKLDEWLPQGYIPKVIDAYKNAAGTLLWVLLLWKK